LLGVLLSYLFSLFASLSCVIALSFCFVLPVCPGCFFIPLFVFSLPVLLLCVYSTSDAVFGRSWPFMFYSLRCSWFFPVLFPLLVRSQWFIPAYFAWRRSVWCTVMVPVLRKCSRRIISQWVFLRWGFVGSRKSWALLPLRYFFFFVCNRVLQRCLD